MKPKVCCENCKWYPYKVRPYADNERTFTCFNWCLFTLPQDTCTKAEAVDNNKIGDGIGRR